MARYIDADLIKEKLQRTQINSATVFVNTVLIGLLNDAPTADVQKVKYARWKGAGMGAYYCSLCQEEYSGGNHFNYCPNCGAKMDGDVG